uniref:BAH domain-containing protein n=1 Tax=Ciona savignyi TaxID=51511 RepID=H2Z7L0_CIOSA
MFLKCQSMSVKSAPQPENHQLAIKGLELDPACCDDDITALLKVDPKENVQTNTNTSNKSRKKTCNDPQSSCSTDQLPLSLKQCVAWDQEIHLSKFNADSDSSSNTLVSSQGEGKRLKRKFSYSKFLRREPDEPPPYTGIRLEKMEIMEMQMKRRLLDLKKRYHQKQLELSRLQNKRKRSKLRSKDKTKSSKSKEGKGKAKTIIKNYPTQPSTSTEPKEETPSVQIVLSNVEDIIPMKTSVENQILIALPSEDDSQTQGSKKRKPTKPKKMNVDKTNNPTSPKSSASRRLRLNVKDLMDGFRILMPREDNLLQAGSIKSISPPDVYGVLLDGERHRNRPLVLCQEEIMKKCVVNKCVSDESDLLPGTRVAAYWTMKMHSLYTGSVASGKHDQGEVHIDFDDGDSSKIPLEQIRLLPADYMLPQSNGYEETQVPAASLKTNNCKAKKSTNTSSGAACSNGSSHSSGNSTESAYWRWHGPCLNQEQKATTKVYYQTIVRDNDVISCGDCAIFLSHGRPNLPYIGLIESMWESWASTMVVRVR